MLHGDGEIICGAMVQMVNYRNDIIRRLQQKKMLKDTKELEMSQTKGIQDELIKALMTLQSESCTVLPDSRYAFVRAMGTGGYLVHYLE